MVPLFKKKYTKYSASLVYFSYSKMYPNGTLI